MTAKLCVARGECDHESCGDWLPPAAPPSEQTLDPLIVMLSTALGGSVALFSKVALCTRNPPSDPGVTCELAGPARPSVTAKIASDVRRMIGRASRIVEFIDSGCAPDHPAHVESMNSTIRDARPIIPNRGVHRSPPVRGTMNSTI